MTESTPASEGDQSPTLKDFVASWFDQKSTDAGLNQDVLKLLRTAITTGASETTIVSSLMQNCKAKENADVAPPSN